MNWKTTTGLDTEQLTELVARVHAALGGVGLASRGRPYVLGLYRSVVLVLFLLRQNPVQQAAAELFGCSQSTVSRRASLLGPLLERVLAEFVPDPQEASGDEWSWSTARW